MKYKNKAISLVMCNKVTNMLRSRVHDAYEVDVNTHKVSDN